MFDSAVTLLLARTLVQKRQSLVGRSEGKLTATYPGCTLQHTLRKFRNSIRRLQSGALSSLLYVAVESPQVRDKHIRIYTRSFLPCDLQLQTFHILEDKDHHPPYSVPTTQTMRFL